MPQIKNKYDTDKLLNDLVGNSKLSKYQKQEVLDSYRNKQSLPSAGIATSRQQTIDDALLKYRQTNNRVDLFPDANKGRNTSKRKLFDEAIFKREEFKPSRTVDRDREKNLLATYNEFGGKKKTPDAIVATRIDKKVLQKPEIPTKEISRITERKFY